VLLDVLALTIAEGRMTATDLVADPVWLELAILD
jgi:hypothetical protein